MGGESKEFLAIREPTVSTPLVVQAEQNTPEPKANGRSDIPSRRHVGAKRKLFRTDQNFFGHSLDDNEVVPVIMRTEPKANGVSKNGRVCTLVQKGSVQPTEEEMNDIVQSTTLSEKEVERYQRTVGEYYSSRIHTPWWHLPSEKNGGRSLSFEHKQMIWETQHVTFGVTLLVAFLLMLIVAAFRLK